MVLSLRRWLLVLRHVSEDPTKNCRVRHLNPALGHDLDEVSVGEPVADVPADAEFDDLSVEDSRERRLTQMGRLAMWQPPQNRARTRHLSRQWPRSLSRNCRRAMTGFMS